jgi:hypothetical protein
MSIPTKILRVISLTVGPTLMTVSGSAQAQSISIAGDVNPTPTPGPTPSPARQPTPTPSPDGSAGCGKAGQATGALDLTISDGKTPNRSYKVMVPTNYNPQVPLPIVMAFHGLGGNSDAAIGFGIQDAQGASASAIFVYPQGSVYTDTTEDAQVLGQVAGSTSAAASI